MKVNKLNVLSIFDITSKNIFGMKRYILDLLRDYPKNKIKLILVKLRGFNKLNPFCFSILNDILLPTYYAILARRQSKNCMFLITSQHLLFALNILPPDRTIIVIFDLIGLSLNNNTFNRVTFALKKRIFANITKANKIIVMSRYIKKQLIEIYSIKTDKIKVIYPDIDTSIFYPIKLNKKAIIKKSLNIDPGSNVILYVGDEVPRKNIFTLIDALVKMKEKGIKFYFIKIGKASRLADRKQFLVELKKKNLFTCTMIYDHINDNRLNEFYNIADVFVFPSLDEGFGLPPLEAMACGTPVIVTKLSSLPEVVGDAGIYLNNPTDYNELAKHILSLISNNDKNRKIIQKGFTQVLKFKFGNASKTFNKFVLGNY